MEILKQGKDGVAVCSVQVATWDELPPLDAPDGLALCCSGTCLRCQKDMDEQVQKHGLAEHLGQIIGLRSAENHMDPCFRFPVDDLEDLFSHATLVESMLVALEHMQVNFVTVSRSGLRKFRRNTLSFPQDLATFAQRMDLMKNYRVNDRVNSVRGPGDDPSNPNRQVRKAVSASAEDRERYAVDALGALVIPGKVLEVRPDGLLLVKYDHGGEGLERPENVTPRLTMPWHPRDVPLHLMLRRNLGRGKDALEGLSVRWWYVANLLQALCAFPPNGCTWRLGGEENEPMHKYYDPRLFHVMKTEEELKIASAPKEVDGRLLQVGEADLLTKEQKLSSAVDVLDAQHFSAAGFDVNLVGREDVLPPSAAPAYDASKDETPGEAVSGVAEGAGEALGVGEDRVDEQARVDEEAFCSWLENAEFAVGYKV